MTQKDSNIKIHLDTGKPFESAIRKFKRLCDAAGILKEYRKRKEYKKPSVQRKEKLESAAKRKSKDLKKSRSHSY